MPPVVAAIATIVANVAVFTGLPSALVAGIAEPKGTVFVDGWPVEEKAEQ
jgi:hypothetical protein